MGRQRLSGPTRIWIDNVCGNNSNTGFTKQTAFKNPQAAVDFVYNDIHLNGFPIEFFLVKNLDSTGNPIPYTGFIFISLLVGQPHDFGVTLRGEKDSAGNVSTLIEDSGNGCVHVAGGGQMYVYDVGLKGTGAPGAFAGYGGLIGLTNVVLYGTGGGTLIAAGPDGKIQLLAPAGQTSIHVYGNAASCVDINRGSELYAHGGMWGRLYGNPIFSDAFAVVTGNGRLYSYNGWDGATQCRKFRGQNGAMFATWSGPEHLPGNSAGSLDASSSYNGSMGPM